MPRFRFTLLWTLLLGTMSCQAPDRYVEIIDVAPAVTDSLLAVGGDARHDAAVGTYADHAPLHAIAIWGDYSTLVNIHHAAVLQTLAQRGPSRRRTNCSMFRLGNEFTSVVGRNYDNVDTELLAAWFYPEDGHASITLSPLTELAYNAERPFDPQNPKHVRSLLYAPIASIEGLNEQGVTVTLASLDRRTVIQHENREPRFLLHLVREILDEADDVNEAVAIASGYDVFDNGLDVITHHIFVTDPLGSVVLEWQDGLMHVVEGDGGLQIVTNSDLLDVPERERRRGCERYRTLAKRLAVWEGAPDWRRAMNALAAAAQKNKRYEIEGESRLINTQWSAVFDPVAREVHVCLHRDWSTVYRLGFPDLAGAGERARLSP